MYKRIEPKPPYRITPHLKIFSLEGTPTPGLYDDGKKVYWEAVNLGGSRIVAFKVVFSGEPLNPAIDVRLYGLGGGVGEEDFRLISSMFRVDFDYDKFLAIVKEDKLFSDMVSRNLGLRPTRCISIYRALVKNVIQQNITLKLALKITGRIVEKYGERYVIDGEKYYAFPSELKLHNAELEELKQMGLSRMKAKAIKTIAEAAVEKRLPSLEEAIKNPQDTIQELKRLYGVGKWTAELTVSMVHPLFPTGPSSDLSVVRGFSRILGKRVSPELIEKLLKRYKDYLGLIMYYVSLTGHTKPI